MNILVLGGTRYFGKHMVQNLLKKGHNITIATRGKVKDDFGNHVNRLIVERTDPDSLKRAVHYSHYDVIYDNLAYCSNDVKHILHFADCDRYVMTSSTAVYNKHIDTREDEFNPETKKLIWCDRTDFPYDEAKRQAECALWQKYQHMKAVAVRFPFVIGKDDYTNRLYFYVEHVIKGIPMFIDNINNQMSFVRSDEAGAFLAFFSENNYFGAINGGNEGTASISEIIEYVTSKTGKTPIILSDGEKAPYNGENEYSINVELAKKLDFTFTPLKSWLYDLLDFYIDKASCQREA